MKELLPLPFITSVNFSDKPLPVCGLTEVKTLSIPEISRKLSHYRNIDFSWTENIYVPDEWHLDNLDKLRLDEVAGKMISTDAFCVCFMNEDVGYGVYAMQPIKKGSVLLYSGTLKKFSREKLYYGMQAGEDYVIDGHCRSGFADLFQDLYEPKIDEKIYHSNVAINNFTAKTLTLSCGAITLLEANTDISVLAQCGVSYGALFWKMQQQLHHTPKKFFTLTGKIIK